MNLASINDKLMNSKWMMDKRSLYSMYNTISDLSNIRAGGLYGKVFGNPVVMKAASETISGDVIEDESSQGDIAIMSINGVLVKGATQEQEELLGWTNTDAISSEIEELADDPSIKCIYLCFASPGGETTGIEELARKIKFIDENVKPVFTWTEFNMCSAAYWLGAMGRVIGMTPSAIVGSIGVYMLSMDVSKQLEASGVKVNAISSGKYKLMGHEFRPLTEDEFNIMLTDVTNQHEKFKDAILSTRPNIDKESMEGLSYEGDDALELEQADIVTDEFADYLSETQTERYLSI
jgi:signal peptide peptidase SppA